MTHLHVERRPIYTYAELRDALPSEVEPRFHGNGFVQLYVGRYKRLHIYHPELFPATVKNARVHDHRWDMTSWVLLGKIRHCTYQLVPYLTGMYRVMHVACAASKDGSFASAHYDGVDYKVQYTGSCTMVAGSEYFFPARHFHESVVTELTMTVVDKGEDQGEFARLVVPFDEEPDHAYKKQPNVDDMWGAIAAAMHAWHRI